MSDPPNRGGGGPGNESGEAPKTGGPEPTSLGGPPVFATFSYLLNGAYSLRRSAQEHEEGAGYCLVASILFSVFSVEAYLNHLGQELDPSWDDTRKGWRRKFE